MFDTLTTIGGLMIALTTGGGGYVLGRWIGIRMSYGGRPGIPAFDRRSQND